LGKIGNLTTIHTNTLKSKQERNDTKQNKQHEQNNTKAKKGKHLHVLTHIKIFETNILNNQANPTHHKILQPKHEVTKHLKAYKTLPLVGKEKQKNPTIHVMKKKKE
jgi:hypothetical protein